ncbi:MAG: MoaD/ThiS family protein [Candidatus Thermoplasmatota archaeon]|nr:MoaD/ThiS family protein [Candidatus Thermoplasmatota archaeon]
MEIEVLISKEKKKLQMDEGATGKDLISLLNFVPDDVILIVNDKPIPYTIKLNDGDKVKILQVASRG